MSTRSRRSRGRPPKIPMSTNRTNFLRKPKAYQNQDLNNRSSESASPLSHYRPGRSERIRGRASAHRGRNFVSHLIAEDDELSSLPEFEDRSSDITDLDNTDALGLDNDDGSEASFDDSEPESSDNESLSTVSSSVSRRKLLLKRPKTPEIQDDKDIPPLELPASATDLLLPSEHVLQAIGVYEVLRHFRIILRLSPFTFEDFSACLLSDEQSNLLAEIHLTLLKALFREEESSGTTFGPQDLKDSINISLFFLDSMTWSEIVRAYLDSENHPEYRAHLSILESPDYPFVPYAEKLKVLQTLTDLFLATTKVREEIINEGNIHYDDHCRACHKLGDLLCCETCSAVYHLACVEPPMQEVPEDDWLCSVCRAHQVKGVTDCVSEAEKSGLLSRQEPVGYDRHARKYWFLCRRIIVEGEKETRYYSTKVQLEELLESLDSVWEPDLITFINEMKDDIIKQMSYTEDLTVAVKGNRKSVLDIENAQLAKVQSERALRREKEEKERKAREEEERKKKEEEEERKKNGENEDSSDKEDESEDKDTSMEKSLEEIIESEAVVTTQTENVTNSVTTTTAGDTTTTEIIETNTTTTTVTTVRSTTTTTTSSSDGDESCDEPPAKKSKIDGVDSSSVSNDGDNKISSSNAVESDKASGTGSIQDSGDVVKDDSKIILSNKSALAEAIKSSTDGKPKVISLQSLLPSARQTLLDVVDKNGDEGKTDGPTKTVLLVNREGGKVTLQVSRQPVSKDETSSNSVIQSTTSTTVNASGLESRKMLTRSKTGSLTPKLFTDSITMTSTSLKASGKSSDEVLVLNKDGEITRMNRGKISIASSLVQQSLYFKLGSEGSYKQYQNQYTTNTLALNKHQHNEERDKRRHLSHKFSLTQNSEFKWNGNIMGNRMSTLATLRLTITQLEGNIQAPFLHSNWSNHRQNWQKAVQMCQSPRDFALAITILEACIKPCVMNPVWHESLGHLGLKRITVADREEWKKKEKEQRRRKEDEEEGRPLVWIKYTMGLKHQVWKQKGEEYRVTGGNGWQWVSATRNFDNETPQDSVGLRLVARRLINRRVKAAKASSKVQKMDESGDDDGKEEKAEQEPDVKPNEDCTVTKKESEIKEEKMETDADELEENEEISGESKEASIENKENSEGNKEREEENMEGTKDKIKDDDDEEMPEEKDEGKKNIKEDKDAKMEVSEEEKKVDVKGKIIKLQRGQSLYDGYLAHVRSKYIEDKDYALALELLKKHPEKVDAELINVSEAMQKRTYYQKVTKPYSKLDNLLERRMKQDEFERKHRLTIETQIALKEKLNLAIEKAQKNKIERDMKDKAETEAKIVEKKNSDKNSGSTSLPYSCYSLSCRTGGPCYSPACRHKKEKEEGNQKENLISSDPSTSKDSANGTDSGDTSNRTSKEGSPDNQVSEDTMDSQISKYDEDEEMKDEDTEDEDNDGLNKENEDVEVESSSTTAAKADVSTEDEEVDIEGDSNKESGSNTTPSKSSSSDVQMEVSTEKSSGQEEKSSGQEDSPKEKSESSKATSVSEIVKNLVIKTMAEKAVASGAGKGSVLTAQALSTAVANISLRDLKAKLPPKRSTSEKFKLAKFSRIGAKKGSRISKNGRLPMCHKFETPSKKKSVLILDRNELRKMARQGAKRESVVFNYNCKMNNVCWPYPCPRPYFKTAWRYRTMTLKSLSAAALQLRILWACIKWDDMAAKPPAGGTNTISTETEITTTELLKRKEVGIDGLRSEFLVRKIVVPLGVPDKPKEKYTPQRSGLRERKRVEAVRQTEPSVTEVWVPEEVLELWEIKQFGEKLEKQRQALQEKEKAAVTQTATVTSSQSTAQIRAQMEQQLKQQRLALAQKRIQENQGIKILGTTSPSPITTMTSASTTTIIINNSNQLGKPGTFKTLTVSSPSSLLSSGVIKTMQPKTIIANAGSLLGSQLRPGVRLQIPGSAILRPQTVALAPKPGSVTTTASNVNTITRLISPASSVARVATPATPQGSKTQTIQIRPQTAGQPVQNLHFTQTPGGQLQVRGLLPGQIIQRMPDGKLQIITLNTSSSTNSTTTPTTTQTTPQQQTPRPAISIRPQQTIMVSPPSGSATTATPTLNQNRLVIPAQLASSLNLSQGSTPTTLTVPAIRQVLASSGASTPSKPIIINRSGGSQIISAQNIASVLGSQNSQLLGTSSPSTLVSAPSVSAALNSAVVISAPGSTNSASTSTSISGGTTVLVNNSRPSALLPGVSAPTGQQTIISTLKPAGFSNPSSTTTTSPTVTTATVSVQPGTSLLAGQIISGTSLLQRPAGGTSLLNINPASASGGTLTISGSPATSQVPKLLGSPPAGTQFITRPVGSTQPQLILRPGTSMLTSAGGQAKVITAQQLQGLSASPIQLKPATTAVSSIKTILSPQSSGIVLSGTSGLKPLTAVRSLTPQLTLQTSSGQQQILTSTKQVGVPSATSILPQALTLTSSPEAGAASAAVTSPTPGTSPGAGGPKYAITPQVVEQVVRQALLQNQTPEIQQKLLAMQKQIQQQQQTLPTAAVAVAPPITPGSITTTRRGSQSSITPTGKAVSVTTSDAARSKSKGLTQEQKEEQSRNSICGQVMKSILDRIEREEKQEQRNKKKQESVEEKQKRMAVMNQQKALYKHKEALKKEILRKRSLMEKNLQQEIFNEMADKLKKTKVSSNTAKSPQAGSVGVAQTMTTHSAVTPVTMGANVKIVKKGTEASKEQNSASDSKSAARKRKQKIISTGGRGLNPREKLYCVCKTPYDDSKFYIGCDLCSNWFHGACVGISEDRARLIDSYICEDCRKQQENTSEELYCLCQTPYDENQFYIGCDRCQDWFHGYCVGISKSEADSIEVYVCPNCQKEEVTDPIAQKPLTTSEYQQLHKLLKDLQSHKMAWPFLNPVDPREVPDYYDIVAEPMDLTIVEAKLNAKAYQKLNDFMKDVTKIFDNCRLYNPVDTPYFQCAEVVETYFAQKVKTLRSANKL